MGMRALVSATQGVRVTVKIVITLARDLVVASGMLVVVVWG